MSTFLKQSVFWTLVVMVTTSSLYAQEGTVNEKKVSMSLGPQSCFYIELQGADKKLAEKTFSEFFKPYGKLKENGKAREFFIMGTKITPVGGSDALDLYVKFEEGKNLSTTYVWIDLGGEFLNSKDRPKMAESMNRWLQDYHLEVRKKVVAEEVRKEEKQLAQLEKDLKRLKEKHVSYEQDIEKARLKILESEKNIEKNLVEQEAKLVEITTQQLQVEKVIEKLNSLGKKIE
jgi:hypothetical protein